MSARNLKAAAVLLVVNAAACASLWAWGRAGWPGKPNHLLEGDAYYCEAIRPGLVKQPANTWSCLTFVAVGLFFALRSRSRRAALFAPLISLIGPASMALHASMTHWGGVADVVSMFLFIAFAICHNAERLRPEWNGRFFALYSWTAPLLTAVAAVASQYTELIFGALIAAFVATDTAVAGGRDRRWLAAAAALFGAGFACWLASERTTRPWCSPYSWCQGHAFWHAFCALAAGAVFLYLEPELAPLGASD